MKSMIACLTKRPKIKTRSRKLIEWNHSVGGICLPEHDRRLWLLQNH